MGLLNQGLEDKVYQKLQGILEQYPEDKYVEVANKLVENKQINISEALYLSFILACYMSQNDFNNSRWGKLHNGFMAHISSKKRDDCCEYCSY